MKRVIFIGQAMPKRNMAESHDWPSLNLWLYSIGLNDKQIKNNFLYAALVDYFPGYQEKGGHKVPTKDEIAKDRKRLGKTLHGFNPEILVTIGKLSLNYCLNEKINSLDSNYIGKSFLVDPYNMLGKKILIIPLPHPSGASTWKYKKGNMELLEKALNLLKDNLY